MTKDNIKEKKKKFSSIKRNIYLLIFSSSLTAQRDRGTNKKKNIPQKKTFFFFSLKKQFFETGDLDQVSNVHGHLEDLSAVELLNLAEHAGVISSDKVDSNTLTTETTSTTDTMDVVLLVGGDVVVDDQGNLLDIDTTGKQVSGDQDTGRSRAELLHDDLTLALLHVSVHGRDSELAGSQLLGQPVDLSAGVAEDDGLGDGDGLVEIAEGVQLPLLLLNSNVELLDTLEGQLVLLDQDTDGVAHELGGNLHNLGGHGGRQEDNLGAWGETLENVVDLVLETTGQHLIGLIKNEHLHVVGLEGTTVDHVKDTTGGTDNNLGTVTEDLHVIADVGASDTGVASDLHEVTEGDDNLLDLLGQLAGGGEDQGLALGVGEIQLLEGRDREGGGLSGTGLSLGNDIVALDNGENGTLLDGRGTLETGEKEKKEQSTKHVLGKSLHVPFACFFLASGFA